ncbi:MAG: hypothetical protein JXN59_19155 [Anaerolineae bacterium]|nr:hypothetical protein [Anaerolineae bacterium]
MTDNETLHEEPMMEEEMLLNEGESVIDAFVRHQKEAAHEAKLAFEALVPEGTRVHGKAAKRAFRKAFKVVLEEISERLEFAEDEDDAPPSSTGPNKVKIEVS